MATVNPARALGMEDTLGSLTVGRDADITVLEQVAGSWAFHDTEGATLKGDVALVPALTIKGGEVFSPDWGPRPWGWLPDSAS
jgi:dihydroorotase